MVIDAFPFNDELDMLEMRLGQMDEVVDHFVMIEVERTYRGDPKPLYYTENKERFAKWNHKIHCITPYLGLAGSWEFEVIQRNALLDSIGLLIRQLSTQLRSVTATKYQIPQPFVSHPGAWAT